MEPRQPTLCFIRFGRDDSHLGCRQNGHQLLVIVQQRKFFRQSSVERHQQSQQWNRYQQWPHRLQSYSEDEQFLAWGRSLGHNDLLLKQYSE